MRTLYLDCGMGAAGDMLTAALLELFPREEQDELLAQLNALGLPGVTFSREASEKCGIRGTHVTVRVGGVEEGAGHGHDCGHEHAHDHDHAHVHDHEHVHHHHHRSLHEIEHLVEGLPVSERVRADVRAVYGLIAEAESHAHGVPVTEVHFHEVGTMDALADVTAVSLLMERLDPGEVVCSPVHVGSGQVRCAHGILPVPAPATAHILRGVPIYGGEVQGELCTPTGAALLRHFAGRFGEMPVMCVETIGYGMGARDFPAANCVRALLGETADWADSVCELCCNLDDMTPEAVGFATEQLLAAGALDAYITPVQMKKSRQGVLLSVMCREKDRDRMLRLMFRHTTTLGVRESVSRRHTLSRSMETLPTELGEVRLKRSSGYGVTREKLEYDDLARIARERDMSLAEVAERARVFLDHTGETVA